MLALVENPEHDDDDDNNEDGDAGSGDDNDDDDDDDDEKDCGNNNLESECFLKIDCNDDRWRITIIIVFCVEDLIYRYDFHRRCD